MALKAALVACIFISLLAVGLAAPIWHDEALILLEFSGHRDWPDHVVSAAVVQAQLNHTHPGIAEFFTNLARLNYDIHPPLYYALLWLWRRVTGDSLIALRLFSCLAWAGVLFVFSRWSPSRFALALLALSPMGLALATLARDYALATFWILLAAWLLNPAPSESEQPQSKTRAVLGAVAAALAVWTHYLALFPVAVIVLSRTFYSWKRERSFVFVMVVVAVLAGCPVAYFARTQLRPPTPHVSLGLAGESYAIARELLRMPVSPFLTAGRIVDVIGSAAFLFALIFVAATFRTQSYKARLSFLVVIAQAAALVLLSLLMKSDLNAGRYLALTAPFAFLLLGELRIAADLPRRIWMWALIAMVAFSAVLDAAHLLRLKQAQTQAFGGSHGAPELVVANSSSGPGIPGVVLHDIPSYADFLASPAAVAPSAYQNVFYCGFDDDASRTSRLFREYSCSTKVSAPPSR